VPLAFRQSPGAPAQPAFWKKIELGRLSSNLEKYEFEKKNEWRPAARQEAASYQYTRVREKECAVESMSDKERQRETVEKLTTVARGNEGIRPDAAARHKVTTQFGSLESHLF